MGDKLEKRYLSLLFVVVIMTIFSVGHVYSEIGRIDYDVDVVDVVLGEIVVSQYVYVNMSIDGEINVPILSSIANVTYEVLSLTVLRDGVQEEVSYRLDIEKNALSVNLKRGFNVLTIDYVVRGVIEEIAPLKYVLILNVSAPGDASLKLKINFPLGYNVTPIYVPQNYSLSTTQFHTRLESTAEGLYIILIEKTIEATQGVGTSPARFMGNVGRYALFVAVGAVSASIGFAIYWFKFRKKLELEAVPADILSDDAVRKMIVAIGDGGENGVKQSDLVRIVGRPKSAVSRRLKKLAEEGYVTITPRGKYNIVKLTSKGYNVYKELKKKG